MANNGNGEYGEYGQVENTNYCMKKSWNARNVEDMNVKMGRYDMSDQANTGKAPTKAPGEKANRQLGPKAADPRKNDGD